jgi:adenine-specific DNA-methyltransferase
MEDEIKTKLKGLLRELFQFENEDLEFGIYRIMNYKKAQIERFIEKDLVEEIGKQLSLLAEEEKGALLKEFDGLKRKIVEAFGEDAFKDGELRDEFKSTPLGKQYQAKLQELEKVRVSEDLERDVYNHIYSFFSRYYLDGDFLSQRRYGRKSKYVVPYNGEETFLYWANKDQYYVKSSEYFRKFSFKVGDLKVNFRVVMAEEETGNVKAQEKKFFVISQEKIWDYDERNDELNIYFEFRGLNQNEKEKFGQRARQDDLNRFNLGVITEKLETRKEFSGLFEKQGGKTVLEKQLNKYTKRNTMDYFIHKDLKGFLEQELDFYIKNEVLNLEDMEKFYKEKLELYLLEARVIRNISLKIIEFLAQIENFQKKIWEKKKFVIKTDYVISLDKIKEYAGEEFLESLLSEVLKNTKQLVEWKELLGIEIKSKKDLLEKQTVLGKEWKKLPIDTRHFKEEFKIKLIEKLSEKNDLDNILNGILIKSENWQALNLILDKFREKIQCIYLDPPFNTGTNEFLYKNNYLDSSWISMMYDRLAMGKQLLKNDGSIYVRIDYHGNHFVRMLMDMIFGKDNLRNETVVKRVNYQGTNVRMRFNPAHEVIYFYGRNPDQIKFNVVYKSRGREPRWVKAVSPKENREQNTIELEGKKFIAPKEHHWRFSQKRFEELYQQGRIRIKWDVEYEDVFGNTQRGIPYYLESEETPVDSLFTDIPSYAFTTGFSTENAEKLLRRIIEASSNQGDWVLDYFLGSGTTTAVAHKLGRRWIGIEVGEFFDNIPFGRMKKVLAGDNLGISKQVNWQGGGFFKYHYVEQYEDALENIEFEQRKLPEFEDYFVKYMLDFETKQSKTFLNIDKIQEPFNYKLKIMENYEPKTVNIDLVETFNYLIGLNISKFKVLNDNGRKYAFVFGEADGRKTLIAWRSIKGIDFEKDKEIISKVIAEFNPEEIYVNGDCIVKGFKQIENEFKTLLFWR